MKRVLLASSYLKDNANYFYRTTNPDLEWDDFEIQFIKAFERHDNEALVRQDLKRLKQTGKVDDYIFKFRIILMQTHNIAEPDKIEYFVNDLSGKTNDYVSIHQEDTHEKNILLANTKQGLTWLNNHTHNQLTQSSHSTQT